MNNFFSCLLLPSLTNVGAASWIYETEKVTVDFVFPFLVVPEHRTASIIQDNVCHVSAKMYDSTIQPQCWSAGFCSHLAYTHPHSYF